MRKLSKFAIVISGLFVTSGAALSQSSSAVGPGVTPCAYTACIVTSLQVPSSSRLSAPADGVWLMRNNAASSFTRLDFGGTSASFFALGASGTTAILAAADGTIPTYASCTALTTNASGVIGCTLSDKRAKIDMGKIPNAMAALDKISAHEFTFKDPKHDFGAVGGVHFGMFAQDIQGVYPQLVHRGPKTNSAPDGELQFDKSELIAVLWEQNKLLAARISKLEGRYQAGHK